MLAYKNRIALILACLLFGAGNTAYPHAVVTESSLAHEPVKPGHATTVVLFFNADVELKLSRVFLVSAGDVHQPVDIARGEKPGELRIRLPALKPGDYAITYKIFAADGHLTESALRFHVAE